MRRQSKTVCYECVGGPRDGDTARVLRRARSVMLNGERYHVRRWVERDERGRQVGVKQCLVWHLYPLANRKKAG